MHYMIIESGCDVINTGIVNKMKWERKEMFFFFVKLYVLFNLNYGKQE